jgi:hypothetical protein
MLQKKIKRDTMKSLIILIFLISSCMVYGGGFLIDLQNYTTINTNSPSRQISGSKYNKNIFASADD